MAVGCKQELLSRLSFLVHAVRLQELESSVEGWTDDLASLFLLRDSLEGVVSSDDITVLQERLQLLQCQWEEVCHQVGQRSFQDLFRTFLMSSGTHEMISPSPPPDLMSVPSAFPAQAAGEREAERVGSVQ